MRDVILRLSVLETPTEWILLCESPAGAATTHVPTPFSPSELLSSLHAVERSLMLSYSPTTRRSVSPEATVLEFGNRLSDAVLSGENRVVFENARSLAKQRGVQLRVVVETDGRNVCQIPWEFAVDPRSKEHYLALKLSLARHLRVSAPLPPLTVEPPLRVLGVHAQPADRETLNFAAEKSGLDAVSSDLVQVTWLESARWRDVSRALRNGDWHALHFIGHGGFDEEADRGFLEFPDEDGRSLRVSATDVGAAASRSHALRLVVLNACESATTGAGGTFSSTAAKLMSEGIAAVVAMQYAITDEAALAFSAGFYEAVARGRPVDDAVTEARDTVRLVTGSSLEWATPVLYLASTETRIFDVTPENRRAASPPPHSPPTAERPAPAPTRAGATQTTEGPRTTKSDSISEVATGVLSWLGKVKGGGDAPGDEGGATPPPDKQPPEPPPHTDPSPAPAPTVSDTDTMRRADATRALAPCAHVAVGPGNLVAMACRDGTVRAWNRRTGRWASRCTLPRGVVAFAVVWSPWPRHVASTNSDGTVVVWDLQQEVPVRVIQPACPALASAAMSSDGRWLAVVGSDRSVQIFDSSGQSRARFVVPPTVDTSAGWGQASQGMGPCAFRPGDKGLVVASGGGTVAELDVRGAVVRTWPHAHPVRALAVSTASLATASVDGRLRFWRWDGAHLHRREDARVQHMAFAPEATLLATVTDDGRLGTWSPVGAPLETGRVAGRPVGVGTDDGRIVTGTEDGVLETWEPDGAADGGRSQ